MYVISLITEHDITEGVCYRVIRGVVGRDLYITDDVGNEFPMFKGEYVDSDEGAYLKYQSQKKTPLSELDILREQIEALQEENAELKFRLDSLEK